MAYALALGLGAVAVTFLLVVVGEIFYLFYWKKRPLAYPRGNSVPVAPINEAEIESVVGGREIQGGVASGTEGDVVISVTYAEYQIAALHQDLVEKLFPATDVSSTQSAQELMGPTRMLFSIAEETSEELEGLDAPNAARKVESGRTISDVLKSELAKSLSDIQLSPLGSLSPASSSTPFDTPPSSPEHNEFITPNATPSRSPLITLSRLPRTQAPLKSSSPVSRDEVSDEISSHEDYFTCCASPPPAPPSPTRPTFPFLVRTPSPGKSSDFPSGRSTSSSCSSIMHDTSAASSEWGGSSTSTSCNLNHRAAASALQFTSPSQRPFGSSFPSGASPSGQGTAGVPPSPVRSSRRSLMANGLGSGQIEEVRVEVWKEEDDDYTHNLHVSENAVQSPQDASNSPASPLPQDCTSVYRNGTFSPSSAPSSPEILSLSSTGPKMVPYLRFPDDDTMARINDSPQSSSPSSTCSSPHSPSNSSLSSSPPFSRTPSDFPSPSPPPHIPYFQPPTPDHPACEHRIHVSSSSSVLSTPSSSPALEDLDLSVRKKKKRALKHSPSRTASRGSTPPSSLPDGTMKENGVNLLSCFPGSVTASIGARVWSPTH